MWDAKSLPTDGIVEEEDACTTDERRGYAECSKAMQQVVAEQQQREQKNNNLGGKENTATAEEKRSEEKGEDGINITDAVIMQFMQQQIQQGQQQIPQQIQSGQQEIESKIIEGTTEKIEKIEENQDILKTRIHEVYQQIDGQINALEGKVDDALSQFDARLNVLEEKVTKVISQLDAKEKMGGTLSQFATLRSEVDALKKTAAKQHLVLETVLLKFKPPSLMTPPTCYVIQITLLRRSCDIESSSEDICEDVCINFLRENENTYLKYDKIGNIIESDEMLEISTHLDGLNVSTYFITIFPHKLQVSQSQVSSRIHIDFFDSSLSRWCLVVVDNYSKWIRVVEIRNNITGKAIITIQKHTVQKQFFPRFGLPKLLVSDNGPTPIEQIAM
uniref:Integrase catalytic domain-containing protein n=1 Tax=Glossina austeni TaxID=7395 RepID=A0A1A9VKZ9_GLOAU